MDEPAESPPAGTAADGSADSGAETPASASNDLAQSILLAGLGAVSLTKEKAESLLDDLVRRGSGETSSEPDEASGAPRAGGPGLTERASSALRGLFQELGLVTEPTIDELELRVAQLEHRLRLLERKAAQAENPSPPPANTRP
jgi:polyhydroxyalkanoate synthesis regulator phasin